MSNLHGVTIPCPWNWLFGPLSGWNLKHGKSLPTWPWESPWNLEFQEDLAQTIDSFYWWTSVSKRESTPLSNNNVPISFWVGLWPLPSQTPKKNSEFWEANLPIGALPLRKWQVRGSPVSLEALCFFYSLHVLAVFFDKRDHPFCHEAKRVQAELLATNTWWSPLIKMHSYKKNYKF